MSKIELRVAVDLLYQAGLARCNHAEYPLDVFFWNAQAHADLEALQGVAKSLACQQTFKTEKDALKRLGMDAVHDIDGVSDLALLFPHKNKQQTLFYMAKAMLSLAEGGRMMMACANVHGAKSYQSALASMAGHVDASSKFKCRVFSAQKIDGFDEGLAQSWLKQGEMQWVDGLNFYSQAGLFSWNRADMGSKILLSQLPKLSGEGMDLCCGYALLSVNVLKHSPDIHHLQLVDAEWQALSCAKKNTEAWLSQCTYHCLDATIDNLPSKLDWVVCNPPFHTRQSREVMLGQKIVAKGCQSLKRGGQIWVVANRQLPYEQVFEQHLREYHSVIEVDGFKIIHGVR